MVVKRIGVIGGGQLAWMMAIEAQKLGLEMIVQTPSGDDPASAIATKAIFAPIDDATATAQLAQHCDVITFENEFINLEALQPLAQQGVCFRPRLEALAPLLDKYQQREYIKQIGLPVPRFTLPTSDPVESPYDFPMVVKARRHGYDGRGTFIIRSQEQLQDICQRLDPTDILLEAFVPFERELAVMVARGVGGEVVVYPVVETQQENQVCRRVFVPAQVSDTVRQQVQTFAQKLLDNLDVVGIFGIEFFLTPDEKVLVNEIAPRTHNSGHYSLDGCDISQFAMQLQAVAGFPLETPQTKTPSAVMVNLLGYEHAHHDYADKRQQLSQIPHAFVHWYGKSESRPGRKLGHVTVLLESTQPSEAQAMAQKVESIWYGD
jgi:5-(carboxyamino)imidazole ribonucleotide synthase